MAMLDPLQAGAGEAIRERLRWAVRVRWLSIVGYSALALLASHVGVLPSLRASLLVGGLSTAVNGLNHWCVARWRFVWAVTALAIPADVILITYLVAETGGVQSPFIMIYVVQVVATAMLVGLVVAAGSALACAACFLGALLLPPGPALPGAVAAAAGVGTAYYVIWGLFLLYCLALLTYLGGYISARLRRSEDDLDAKNRTLQQALAEVEDAHADLQATYDRLKTTEAQLVQSEKMRALGQFVAGIAHELNNPITFVSANLEHLQRAAAAAEQMLAAYAAAPLPGATQDALAERRRVLQVDALLADLPSALEDCREGARRAAEIVAALRAFARADQPGAWGQVDLRERLDRTLALLRHRLGTDIEVAREYSALPLVECLPGQLDQVFLNLLANAIDAVGSRGRVTVRTWLEASPPAPAGPGPHAAVAISDDGRGIPAEIQPRVFDPFFTTKPEGQGTGLGLSVSYGIVQRHGGAIALRSVVGSGSTFTVYLPVRRPEARDG